MIRTTDFWHARKISRRLVNGLMERMGLTFSQAAWVVLTSSVRFVDKNQ